MPAEALYVQDGLSIDFTPTAAVVAGEIIHLPDGRAAFAPTAIAAGVKGAVQVRGIVEVQKSITQTMLVSNYVYWDHSASKCNLLHGGDQDFGLGTVIEDVAYTATTVKVNLNAKPAFTLSLADGYHHIKIVTAGLMADVYGGGNGVGMRFDVTAEAQKLDALSINSIATGTPGILQAKVCINLNMDNAAGDFNIGMADASHATDADAIVSSLFLHTDGAALTLNIESDNAAAEVAATSTTLSAVVGTPFLVTWDMRDWANIKTYISGLRVGDGVTGAAVTLTLAGVAGPLKLLAHMEKTSDDSPGNITVQDFGFTALNVQSKRGGRIESRRTMTNMLEDGAAWLVGQMKDHASRTVRYERINYPMLTDLKATVHQQEYTVFDGEGVMTSVTAFDWTFAAADFIDRTQRNAPIKAQPGDTICEIVGGVKRRYEVMPLGDKPAQEFLDDAGIIVLVHTKRIRDN